MSNNRVEILQNSWSHGLRRNKSKDQIGGAAIFDSRDFVPDILGAPMRKRGGWGYNSGTFANAPFGYARSLVWAPQNGGRFLLASEEDGTVQRSANGNGAWGVDGVTRNIGAIKQNPIFYFDDVIWPSYNGTQTLSRSNETTTTEYTFTSGLAAGQQPVYLTQWKARMLGAVGENLYFGPPGDPNQAWDPVSKYVRTQPITGLSSVQSAAIVFYDSYTDRILGDVPAGYGVTEDDLVIQTLFPHVGCLDAFSITGYGDYVLWADRKGYYMTDGATPVNLVEKGGILPLWRELMVTYDNTLHRVAAGVHEGIVHVAMTVVSTGAEVWHLACDIERRIWWRYSNCAFTTFASSLGYLNETWAGLGNVDGRVATLSGTLTPTAANRADANAVDVEPWLEGPFYRFSGGKQQIADVFLGYVLDP